MEIRCEYRKDKPALSCDSCGEKIYQMWYLSVCRGAYQSKLNWDRYHIKCFYEVVATLVAEAGCVEAFEPLEKAFPDLLAKVVVKRIQGER